MPVASVPAVPLKNDARNLAVTLVKESRNPDQGRIPVYGDLVGREGSDLIQIAFGRRLIDQTRVKGDSIRGIGVGSAGKHAGRRGREAVGGVVRPKAVMRVLHGECSVARDIASI